MASKKLIGKLYFLLSAVFLTGSVVVLTAFGYPNDPGEVAVNAFRACIEGDTQTYLKHYWSSRVNNPEGMEKLIRREFAYLSDDLRDRINIEERAGLKKIRAKSEAPAPSKHPNLPDHINGVLFTDVVLEVEANDGSVSEHKARLAYEDNTRWKLYYIEP